MTDAVHVDDAVCPPDALDDRWGDLPDRPPADRPEIESPGPSTVKRYYRVDKREISFFRFVLEGCEGLAVMTTIDPSRGVVVFSIAPGCEMEFERVLEGLQPDILMEPVSPDADKPGQ